MTRVVAAAPGGGDAHRDQRWGRYAVYGEIASGGMATIDYGRLLGPHGFARPVAIKRLHPQFAKDPEFVAMFVDEARMSARLHHANVIPTLDVVDGPGELALVMEYVHGESLATLLDLAIARGQQVPVRVAVTLLAGVLHGLHAAHEAVDDRGRPLRLVHRDVSPQNVLVGQDGVPRVLDFGIAKAIGRLRTTPSGEVKGKLGYIAPEQLCGAAVDRRADVYGASAVLWEALAGRQLFDGPNESMIMHAVLNQPVPAPSTENPHVPPELDRIVLRGLARGADARFASAREMALALEHQIGLGTQSEVSDWLQQLAGAQLARRARELQQMQERAERAGAGGSGIDPAAAHGTRRLELAQGANADPALPVSIGSAPRRTARGYMLWLALGVSVLVAAIWGFAHGGALLAKSAPVEPARPSSAPPQPASEPAPVLVQPAPTHDPVAATPPTTPQSGGVRTAPASSPRHRPRPAHADRAEKPAPTTDAKSEGASVRDCIPPYVIDREGVRHPKLQCL